MGEEILYNTLIFIVLILKLTYVVITVLAALSNNRWDNHTQAVLNKLKHEALIASEVFMYIVLVIIFFPRKKAEDIRVGREEQLIFFILGILGLLHTNWEVFGQFFLHAGNILTDK